MSGIDVASIIAQVGKASSFSDEATSKITNLLGAAATITGDSTAVATQAAIDAATVKSTEQAANLRTQSARQKIGLDFGTDASQQNQIYTHLSEVESEAWNGQQEVLKTINDKQSVGFLDDPLTFISNKLTIDADIGKYNGFLRTRQDALDRIEELNSVTSSSAILQAQFSNSITVTSAEAATRLAASQATLLANNSKLEGIKYNVEGIKEATQANAQKLGFMFSAQAAQNSAAHLALAAASNAREAEKFAFQKEEKLKDDKWNSSIVDSVNVGRVIRGLQPLTGVKAEAVIQNLKGKGPLADEFTADWKAGETFGATNKVQLSSDPAGAVALFTSGRAVNLPPAQELVKEKLGTAMELVSLDKTLDRKDAGAVKAALNKATAQVVLADSREVKPGDSKNLFSIAPINQIVQAGSASAETPIYQKLLKPLIDNGVDLNDPNKVISATVAGMKDGTISYNDAISLTTIYQQAQAANLAQRDLPKFGIDPVFQYNVRVSTPNSLAGSSVYDLTKPDVLGRLLNRLLVNPNTLPLGTRQ